MSHPNFLVSWARCFHTDIATLKDPGRSVLFFLQRGISPDLAWLVTLLNRFQRQRTVIITALSKNNQMVQAQVVSIKTLSDKYFEAPQLYNLRQIPGSNSESKAESTRTEIDLGAEVVVAEGALDIRNPKNNGLSLLASAVWYRYYRSLFLHLVRLCKERKEYTSRVINNLLAAQNHLEHLLKADTISFEMLTHWPFVRTMYKLFLFIEFQLSFDTVDETLLSALTQAVANAKTNDLSNAVRLLNDIPVFLNFRFAPLVQSNFWFEYEAIYETREAATETVHTVNYRAPLMNKKCAHHACSTWISFGGPFCRRHTQRLRLSPGAQEGGVNWSNREQLEILNSYKNGVFATEAIRAGDLLLEYNGPLVTKEEIERRYHVVAAKKYMPYTIELTNPQNMWIDGSLDRDLVFMIRQSDSPNVVLIQQDNKLWLGATKNIAPDEELFLRPVNINLVTKNDVFYRTSSVTGNLTDEDKRAREASAVVTMNIRNVPTLTSRLVGTVTSAVSSVFTSFKELAAQVAKKIRSLTPDQITKENKKILSAIEDVKLEDIPEEICPICHDPLKENGNLVIKVEDIVQQVIDPVSKQIVPLSLGAPLTVSRVRCASRKHLFHTTCITQALYLSNRCPMDNEELFEP
jgi:hypothetical protein